MRAWTVAAQDDDVRLSEVPSPTLQGGGVLVEVLAAHLPAYTKMVVKGNRGGLPVPLTLGPSCIARVTDVAPDVFHVAPGDIVLDTALLDAGWGTTYRARRRHRPTGASKATSTSTSTTSVAG